LKAIGFGDGENAPPTMWRLDERADALIFGEWSLPGSLVFEQESFVVTIR
jgi:hypothetical protein